MKIVMRYDAGKNAFVLAEQECEGIPAAVITAKAYCEYGTSPTKIVVEVPGTLVTPEEEALVMEAMAGLKTDLEAALSSIRKHEQDIAGLNEALAELNVSHEGSASETDKYESDGAPDCVAAFTGK